FSTRNRNSSRRMEQIILDRGKIAAQNTALSPSVTSQNPRTRQESRRCAPVFSGTFVPGAEMRMARKVVPIDAGLKTGAPVPRSGIYSVRHSEHRLPEEVTLLRGEEFPRCAGCESPFLFRLRRELPNAASIPHTSLPVTRLGRG